MQCVGSRFRETMPAQRWVGLSPLACVVGLLCLVAFPARAQDDPHGQQASAWHETAAADGTPHHPDYGMYRTM